MSEALSSLGAVEPLRILLTGSTGQVGGDLLPVLRSFATVVAPTSAELDLKDPDAVRSLVRQVQPHWIVNPAAYTAVDKAESELEAARALNAVAPEVLGEEAVRCGAAMIHFSTDYVFDGSGNTPWRESDEPNPLSVYGRTKLEGEASLQATATPSIILRTSWVYNALGKNFLRTILRLAESREELRIVADQFGAPTWSYDLALAVRRIIQRTETTALKKKMSRAEVMRSTMGIFHTANAGETTWHGFATEFLRLAQEAKPDSHYAKLVPIRTEDYPTPARRPLNSRLDCSRLRDTFDISLPSWKDSVAQVMQQVAASAQ